MTAYLSGGILADGIEILSKHNNQAAHHQFIASALAVKHVMRLFQMQNWLYVGRLNAYPDSSHQRISC